MGQTAQPNPGRAQTRIRYKPGLDLLVVLLLFVAGLGVRFQWADVVVFPPSEEAAFHIVTAENNLAGRGLETDVLWTYQPAFQQVTHPSHEFWMPLVTALIAAALAAQRALSELPGNLWHLAQMPGIVLGALLPPVTYLFGRRVLQTDEAPAASKRPYRRWPALGAALLVLVSATLNYQSGTADGSAVFGLLAAGALMTAIHRPGEPGGYLGTGLLVGLAFLTHLEGLWLLLAIPLAWWLLPAPKRTFLPLPDSAGAPSRRKRRSPAQGDNEEWRRAVGPGLRDVLDLAVAFSILAVSWLARNYLAFGTPLPQALTRPVWLRDAVDLFGYLGRPTVETWLSQSWSELVQRWGEALWQNAGLLATSTYPWGLLALPGLWLLRREWPFVLFLTYGSLVAVVAALVLPVTAMSGTLNRALGGLIPFLALAAMYTLLRITKRIRRMHTPAVLVCVLLVLLFVLQAAPLLWNTLPILSARSEAEQQHFEEISNWLTENSATDAVIMTNRGHTLTYTSGHPTIALPGNEVTDAAWAAAQRYHARVLVVVGHSGYYPEILREGADARFQPALERDEFAIYRIRGAQP